MKNYFYTILLSSCIHATTIMDIIYVALSKFSTTLNCVP